MLLQGNVTLNLFLPTYLVMGMERIKPTWVNLDHINTLALIHHCWLTCYEANQNYRQWLLSLFRYSLLMNGVVWGGLSAQTTLVHTPLFRAPEFCGLERCMDWTSELD